MEIEPSETKFDDFRKETSRSKLMGKHVRTLVGEGAPPPWVPFGTRSVSSSSVDTSQRAMDVAKGQQPTEEDPEFVRARRAAIDQLVNDQGSKIQRFARQDVMRAANVAKGFEQVGRKAPLERPTTATASKPTPISSNARRESREENSNSFSSFPSAGLGEESDR